MVDVVVNDVTRRIQYVAIAAQTVFTYPFIIWQDSDLAVYLRASSSTAPNDVTQLLTLNTDYTVQSAGASNGGTITLNSGASAGNIITIIANQPEARTSYYTDGGRLRASDLNVDLDKIITMASQNQTYLQDLVTRYWDNSTPNNLVDLRLPILPASSIWRKNAGNTAIETVTLPAYPVGASSINDGTANHLVRWDGTATNIVQDSVVNLSDSGYMSGLTELTVDNIDLNGSTINAITGDLNLTAGSNVAISGIKYPNTAGLVGQLLALGVGNELVFTDVQPIPWMVVPSDITMAPNAGFITSSAGLVTLTLPLTASVGDVFRIAGYGSGGWAIAQQSGQSMVFGTTTTTTGLTGSLASFDSHAAIELVCVSQNTVFLVVSVQGNITFV